jgi:hypothetical protein
MTTDPALIAEISERCFAWQIPEDMIALADQLSEALGYDAMMRIGRTFREAFIAGRFARRRGAEQVRLLKEDGRTNTPDFELQIGGRTLRFETTEADIPGRRRSDEFRQPPRVEPIIFTNLDVMVERMRELASAKAAKQYDDCHGLVIWVNPPAFSFNPQMRWDSLVRGGEPAAAAFTEVWAMRGEGSLLWLNGVEQPEVPGEEF